MIFIQQDMWSGVVLLPFLYPSQLSPAQWVHLLYLGWYSCCCVVMFFTLTDRASTIYKYVVANPVRDLLDRKRSGGHLQSSNESIKTIQKRQNERDNITQSTGQNRVEEGHSTERVCHSASREPPDTLPELQPCTSIIVAGPNTTRKTVFQYSGWLHLSAMFLYFKENTLLGDGSFFIKIQTLWQFTCCLCIVCRKLCSC